MVCREVNLNPEDRVSLEISQPRPVCLISVEGKDLNWHICEERQECQDFNSVSKYEGDMGPNSICYTTEDRPQSSWFCWGIKNVLEIKLYFTVCLLDRHWFPLHWFLLCVTITYRPYNRKHLSQYLVMSRFSDGGLNALLWVQAIRRKKTQGNTEILKSHWIIFKNVLHQH